MACLLITYDLNKESKRPNITGAIKKFPSWAKLSESSYAIWTNDAPSAVFDYLKPYLDGNDQLYIIHLKKPYAGLGPKDVNAWLSENLP